jgi:hypothetical protein
MGQGNIDEINSDAKLNDYFKKIIEFKKKRQNSVLRLKEHQADVAKHRGIVTKVECEIDELDKEIKKWTSLLDKEIEKRAE